MLVVVRHLPAVGDESKAELFALLRVRRKIDI